MPRNTIAHGNVAKGEWQKNRVVLLLGSFSNFPEILFNLGAHRPLPVFMFIAELFSLNNGGACLFLASAKPFPLSLPLLKTEAPTVEGRRKIQPPGTGTGVWGLRRDRNTQAMD